MKEEDVAALEDEMTLRAKRHEAKIRGADVADSKPRLFVDPGVPRLPNAAWARLGMPPPGPQQSLSGYGLKVQGRPPNTPCSLA